VGSFGCAVVLSVQTKSFFPNFFYFFIFALADHAAQIMKCLYRAWFKLARNFVGLDSLECHFLVTRGERAKKSETKEK